MRAGAKALANFGAAVPRNGGDDRAFTSTRLADEPNNRRDRRRLPFDVRLGLAIASRGSFADGAPIKYADGSSLQLAGNFQYAGHIGARAVAVLPVAGSRGCRCR